MRQYESPGRQGFGSCHQIPAFSAANFFLSQRSRFDANAILANRSLALVRQISAPRRVVKNHIALGREGKFGEPLVELEADAERLQLTEKESRVAIEAHDLTFRYGERARAVLQNCSLQIRAGDRILLECSSGGGKSTLAALLAGLREPLHAIVMWRLSFRRAPRQLLLI
jgi:ABC-type multidrug transport system fused ATPase/permease subunit